GLFDYSTTFVLSEYCFPFMRFYWLADTLDLKCSSPRRALETAFQDHLGVFIGVFHRVVDQRKEHACKHIAIHQENRKASFLPIDEFQILSRVRSLQPSAQSLKFISRTNAIRTEAHCPSGLLRECHRGPVAQCQTVLGQTEYVFKFLGHNAVRVSASDN